MFFGDAHFLKYSPFTFADANIKQKGKENEKA